MYRTPMLFGLGILALSLLVGAGATQDGKKDKEGKKEEKKFKPALPPGFKGLNLSKEQVAKIYSVQADYHVKIVALEAKIKELKDARGAEEFKVLTDEQRDKYLKSKGVEVKDKASTKDTKDEPKDKKDDGKDKK